MDDAFLSVIAGRHCKRAYLERPVQRDVLEEVLRCAANAPSTRNSQLWQVAVLTGAARDGLSRTLCQAFDDAVPPKLDYKNRPEVVDDLRVEWGRAADAGQRQARGVPDGDKAARRAALRENLTFFGAPVEMVFHLPSNATAGTFLELGFFLQNVMLGLVACGLGSCPQGTVAGYADLVRRFLGLGPDRLVVCGLAVGYADETAPVNAFWPARAALEQYANWVEHVPTPPAPGRDAA